MNLADYHRKNPKRALLLAVSSIMLLIAVSIAITLGIESRNDGILAAQIKESESELRMLGGEISEIKDHEFETMPDYIDAYARVEPLANLYDQKLRLYGIFAERRNGETPIGG
jgi:hypothetical protein